jgi:hypothetical protein
MDYESKSIFLLVLLIELLVIAFVSGNECRTSKTVVASAKSVDDNTAGRGGSDGPAGTMLARPWPDHFWAPCQSLP